MRKLVKQFQQSKTGVLLTGAAGCLSASAWVGLGLWAGLAAVGVSLAFLEFMTGDE